MIKAIETEYRDFRFRSRLEARWAVFFDAVGISWEYEPEGYDADGVWYLPDFRVKFDDEQFFVEVKGEMQKEDRSKIESFVSAGVFPVLILGNIPTSLEEIDKDYKSVGCFELLYPEKAKCGFRGDECFFEWCPETKAALKKARGARFEHSEKPDFNQIYRCKGIKEIKHFDGIPYMEPFGSDWSSFSDRLLAMLEDGGTSIEEMNDALKCVFDEETIDKIIQKGLSTRQLDRTRARRTKRAYKKRTAADTSAQITYGGVANSLEELQAMVKEAVILYPNCKIVLEAV